MLTCEDRYAFTDVSSDMNTCWNKRRDGELNARSDICNVSTIVKTIVYNEMYSILSMFLKQGKESQQAGASFYLRAKYEQNQCQLLQYSAAAI